MMNISDMESQFTKVKETINNLLENEPNPFVKMHLKDLFLSFAEEKFEILKEIPFSIRLKAEINFLTGNLKKLKFLFPNKLKKELQQIRQLLNNINFNEKHFWEPAEIFLKLPSIMSLNRHESSKILNIIKNIKTSKEIEDFLEEKYKSAIIKQADLENEVKKFNKKKTNLTTLISQIWLKKPIELPVFKRINANLNNMDFFINKTIYISNSEYSQTYIGKIKLCKFENNSNDTYLIIQAINNSYEEAVITVNFDSQRITRVKVLNKFYKTLKDRIYMYYKTLKENDVIFKKTYITKNRDFMFQKTSVLEDGFYDAIIGSRFRLKTGHFLHFINSQNGKETKFEIYDSGLNSEGKIEIKNAIIKHKEWNSPCDFDEFLKFFKVLTEEENDITFNTEEEVNSLFKIEDYKIGENESYEIVKKTEEIYDIQSYVICILIENGQNGSLFDLLIERILTSPNYRFNSTNILQEIESRPKGKDVIDGINTVLNIKKSLGYETDELNILSEIVNQCNYTRLIEKEQGIKTERLMALLTKGKQITDEMKDKTIIAFFGNTGSGKSTTVNYFTGVPLIKTKSNFGGKIIKIDETEFQGNSAKIGHSLGTSETLYAQAYKIIEDTYEEDTIPRQRANDLSLCDNPGFGDTRGTDFEICTNLSIDQAILNCSKLQAAVLVLPFSVFLLDRGNHLIEAISNMEERFLDLLNMKSSTLSSFFIAITKFTEEDMEGFERRLTTHIAEESKNKSEFSRNKEDDHSKIYFNKKRLEIFNCLMRMWKSKQIFFIHINDTWQREEQFSEVYKRVGIEKSKYNRSMQGSEMLKKFSGEINKTCNTWHKLILKQYLIKIPKGLQQLRDSNKDLVDSIAQKKNEIEEIGNEIAKWKQEIEELNRKLIQGFNDVEFSGQVEDEEIKGKKLELMQLKEKMESLRIKLNRKEKDLGCSVKEINELEETLKLKRQQKDKYSTGETVECLVDDCYKYGEEYSCYDYKEGRMDKALRNVKPLEFGDDEVPNIYKAGFIERTLCSTRFIEKKYCLVPENTKFDEEGILKKYEQGGIYKAKIQSNLCKLTGVNASPDGKRIVIQYQNFFKVGTDLPYMKITHTIPNEKVFADIIININSEILLKQSRLSTLKNYKNDLTTEINRLSQDMTNIQKHINEVDDMIKKISAAKSKELKVKQIKEEIETLEKRILDSEEQTKRKEKEIEEDEARLAKAKRDLSNKESDHKKLALLIWDQLEKNIPQSLYDYIQIAYDIENNRDASRDHENILESKRQQYKNFEAFKKIFSQEYSTLKERVSKHLQIQN